MFYIFMCVCISDVIYNVLTGDVCQGGTARSSFGKVRSTDHHHVADGAMVGEGDVDDGTVVSLSSVDYGEYVARAPASQYPVSTAGDASRLPDWIPPAQYSGMFFFLSLAVHDPV